MCASLIIDQSMDYDIVKATVLRLCSGLRAGFVQRVNFFLSISLNKKWSHLSQTAACADEFVLTSLVKNNTGTGEAQSRNSKWTNTSTTASTESRKCFYCHEAEHLISDCPSQSPRKPKSVGLSCLFCPKLRLLLFHPISSDKPDEPKSIQPNCS